MFFNEKMQSCCSRDRDWIKYKVPCNRHEICFILWWMYKRNRKKNQFDIWKCCESQWKCLFLCIEFFLNGVYIAKKRKWFVIEAVRLHYQYTSSVRCEWVVLSSIVSNAQKKNKTIFFYIFNLRFSLLLRIWKQTSIGFLCNYKVTWKWCALDFYFNGNVQSEMLFM